MESESPVSKATSALITFVKNVENLILQKRDECEIELQMKTWTKEIINRSSDRASDKTKILELMEQFWKLMYDFKKDNIANLDNLD